MNSVVVSECLPPKIRSIIVELGFEMEKKNKNNKNICNVDERR